MSIPDSVLEQIRERLSLADLVEERTPLKASGHGKVGLCPFHQEKTASFHVNEERGYYHCFGCGAHGDVFSFLMQSRDFSFPEAVRFLANRAGVTLPEVSKSYANHEKQDLSLLKSLNHEASQIYHSCLTEDSRGRLGKNYLLSRGLDETILEEYNLGYAPPQKEFLLSRLMLANKFSEINEGELRQKLCDLGLLRKHDAGENSRYTDFFFERVMFPITRSDGLTLAFGGRLLMERGGSPKYLNSRETLLYQKRRNFYGLNQALPEIRKHRQLFIVEGYMDVLALAKSGIKSAIATCGTALTSDHVNVLRRFANRVTLLFDGDQAGRKAATDCFEQFLNSQIEVSVSVLPEGEDPDSLAQKFSQDKLKALIMERSRSLSNFYAESLRGASLAPAAIGKAAKRFATQVSKVQNPVERELLLREGAESLGVTESSLTDLLNDLLQVRYPVSRVSNQPKVRTIHSYGNQRKSFKGRLPDAVINRSAVIGDYYWHAIVAVLHEPSLADYLLELDLRKQLSEMPENIRECLQEISSAELSSLDLSEENAYQSLIEILNRHALPGNELMLEAKRQNLIGGISPRQLVDEAESVSIRGHLRGELQQIMKEETSSLHDSDKLLKLAQEKLLKRRSLEQVSCHQDKKRG